jgi:hypothetical protein
MMILWVGLFKTFEELLICHIFKLFLAFAAFTYFDLILYLFTLLFNNFG